MGKINTIFAIFLVSIAQAQTTKLPLMESFFGATATNASIGNTQLTVGISKYGEVVNLRWPCFTHFDQLNFKTLHPLPAGWSIEDYNRSFNTGERKGSFAGLRYLQNGKTEITWFRNEDWSSVQTFENDIAPILITTHTNEKIGIKVVCTDLVLLKSDILQRNYRIEKISEQGLSNIEFLNSTNLALCNSNPIFEPKTDWIDDNLNGYVTLYDNENQTFVSYNPEKKGTISKPSKDLSTLETSQFAKNLDKYLNIDPMQKVELTQQKNIFSIIGADRISSGFYLFEDGTKPLAFPSLPNSKGSNVAFGPALCIGAYPVQFINNQFSITTSISFASNYNLCVAQYEKSKSKFDNSKNESINHWNQKMEKATFPNVPDPKMLRTLKRNLVNILIACHPEIGGIPSSTSANQPPYTMIWPRDAANIGYVLDCAGFHEEAENNARFFAKTQRKNDGEQCRQPNKGDCYKGTWFHCFYGDGKPAWMYDMEIDQVGYGIWMFYSHALFLNDEQKIAFLKEMQPNIKMAADFLVWFKDEKNGLQKKATEDDLLWKSQTILGGSTIVMGLKSAIAALKILDPNDPDIVRYQNRLNELTSAIEKKFWKAKTKQYQKAVYGNFGPRGIMNWPCIYLPQNDEKMQGHAAAINKQIIPYFNMENSAMNKEWWYLGKATLALAFAWEKDVEKTRIVQKYLKTLLTDVCTQDTYSYGETPLVRDVKITENGKEMTKRVYDNRVGQPCNIAAAYIYLTAEMLYGKGCKVLKY